jgi:hypothetical protein
MESVTASAVRSTCAHVGILSGAVEINPIAAMLSQPLIQPKGEKPADYRCLLRCTKMYGPPPECKGKAKGEGQVCANVFGL